MLSRHRRFLLAVGLLSYLCEDSTALNPNLSSTTDQIVLKEGEPLRLHCSGNSDIFFTYPTTISNKPRVNSSYTSPIEINKSRDENGTYWYNIYRPNTVFGDTGWYGCSYHPILTTINNYSNPEVTLVYVYVESETPQFVVLANLTAILTTVRENIVIPCRPTSPTAEVRLAEWTGVDHNYAIPKYTFDPKLGMTLLSFDFNTFGTYICYMVPAQKVSYVVHFLRSEENTLSQPMFLNNTMQHVVKGDTLHQTCVTIATGNMSYDQYLFWIPNKIIDRGNTSYDNESLQNDTVLYRSYFKVTNVTYEDEGIYECIVATRYTSKSSRTYVQVHDSIDPFIKLTTQDPNRYYEYYEGDKFVWVIEADAYPSTEIQWLNPKGEEIILLSLLEDCKYSIDTLFGKQTLEIDRLDIHDRGTYTIQAFNQCKRETLSFRLNILAKPKLYIRKRRTHYFRHQVDKIECHVEAFPEPNITWTYRKCPNYPSCENGTVHYLTDSRENVTETHLRSTVTAILETSGELTCSACNTVGCGNVTEGVSVSDAVGEFGIILTNEQVAVGDDLELICAASVNNYLDVFEWSMENGPTLESVDVTVSRERTESTYRSILKVPNVTMEVSGVYVCVGMSTNHSAVSSDYRLEVKVPRAPVIYDTNLKGHETIVDVAMPGSEINLHCFADGIPKPSIRWFKDGIQLTEDHNLYKFLNDSQILQILVYPFNTGDGEYTCQAESRIGEVEVSQRITITGFVYPTNRPVAAIIFAVLLPAVFLIIAIYCVLKVNRGKSVETHVLCLEKGAVESLTPDESGDDQACLLSHHERWEFPQEKLKLGKQLGSGAFGVVLKAEAMGICEREAVTTVAVKMVRRGPNLFSISALASELKIMIHLGKHLNIVNLLGACTKNLLKHDWLVIVEFCRFGNLHDYLLRNRNGFINQIDPASGKLDLSIGRDLSGKSVSSSASNRLKSAESSASVSKNRNSHSDSVQFHTTNPHDLYTSVDDPVLMSTRSGSSKCQGDYKDSNLKPICTQDLLSWAFQVARGMEYLSQRRIVHCNLAARNILLTDDNVVKICDFSLAKSMYKEEIYKKKSDCPLPIKWLSIESMRDLIFSSQSDVWSFGIVLWELFTLAETPYPGMRAEMVYQKLIEGYRTEQPEYATSEVYDVMRQCWNAEPSLRPSFTELVDSVGNLLEDNVRSHYIELNTPYLDMNKTLPETGMNDYLPMASDPGHVVLSPPAHHYGNSTASATTSESGYTCMNRKGSIDSSPMLDEEEEDPYLIPIDFQQRRAEISKTQDQ